MLPVQELRYCFSTRSIFELEFESKDALYNKHSITRANLNKSKKVWNSTTTASKYIPKRPTICINLNPPFQTQIYLVKVPLNVNIVKQDLLDKNSF